MKSKIKRLTSSLNEKEAVEKKAKLIEKASKIKTVKECKALLIELIKIIK